MLSPWAHRYCDDTWTVFRLHIYIWLVPVLIIPRSCSIVFVPDYSSWPLWCILWYMVLRKYCTRKSRLRYKSCFISSDGNLFLDLWSTPKTTYCIWPDYLHASWILIVLPTMHLMTVLQIKYVFIWVQINHFVKFKLSSRWWHWRGRK